MDLDGKSIVIGGRTVSPHGAALAKPRIEIARRALRKLGREERKCQYDDSYRKAAQP